MLWHKVQGAGGLASSSPVTYSGISGSQESGGMTVPATTKDQMLVVITRANSATPVPTFSGFTSALTVSNVAVNRSVKVQYRIGENPSEVLDNALFWAYLVLDNATGVGSSNTISLNESTEVVPYPSLTPSKTDGTSLVLASTYVPSVITGESGPLNLIIGAGAYLEYITSDINSGTLTHASAIFKLSFTLEFI